MIIKKDADVHEIEVKDSKVSNVFMRILVGPEDGSNQIVMRRFRIMPGGHTPYHQHPHEHLVLVEAGKGLVVSESGDKIEMDERHNIFVPGGEFHQFRNPNEQPLQFICVIPNIDKDK